MENNSLSKCLFQFKDVYNFLTFFSDVEFEKLLDQAIKSTSEYLLKSLQDTRNTTSILQVVNTCSRMGLIDTNNVAKVEKAIIPRIAKLRHEDFVGLMYSFSKNKYGSEGLYTIFETKCRSIIMGSNKESISPYVISMITKSNKYY